MIQSKGKSHPLRMNPRCFHNQISLSQQLEKKEIKQKRKAERSAFLQVTNFICKMKIIKKGQTDPVYSAYTNRAFERI
ncbi:hypothetical protein EI976_02175 [Bacillus licheniformis]|nr:hypothetical protein C1T27_14180 [Bacillus licheniformis]KUL10881.1 hypothetical protein LI17339_10560 [Bacillus licheniformis LMG 17339]KAA0813669.1 hypothetical protein EI978_11135 [Bacillus licheniformis]KAA0825882.1 hypothetical protein EI976_02175 [Bacillus licheniformis]KAA0838003.1 hypothetical protein EI973_04845 [Bacillus licheniformis]